LLEWKNDTSYPFAVWSQVALVGQDDCIYVFGGQNSSYDAISNSYKYNTTAGSPKEWVEIESMPTAVSGATGCVANDGRFFLFGGGAILQIYNTTDNSWTNIPNMPSGASIADYDMSCALDSSTGLMYITGGDNNGTRFYSYNSVSNTITNLSTSSSVSFNFRAQGSFVNNGKLYVFGGYSDTQNSGSNSLSLSSTYIYNIANSEWSTGEDMTQAASQFGYATDGSRFYAIGGGYDGVGSLDYTQVYDISSGIWSVNNGQVYSEGMHGNAAVFLDGSLHSIGGANVSYDYLSVHCVAKLCGVYNYNGPCDDGNQCTTNDTCTNGTCSGTSITCPPPNQCQTNATCNPTTGCVYTNVSGRSCNDNNQCLLNTICSNGECTGQSKNCSGSTCDPSTGECVTSSTTTSPTSSSSTIGSTSISSSIIAGFTFGLLIFLD
jgi:hypothetical protein